MTDRRLRAVTRTNFIEIEKAFAKALEQLYSPATARSIANAHMAVHARLVRRVVSPKMLDTRQVRQQIEQADNRSGPAQRETTAASEESVRQEILSLLGSTPDEFVAESVICLSMQVFGWPASHTRTLASKMKKRGEIVGGRYGGEKRYKCSVIP